MNIDTYTYYDEGWDAAFLGKDYNKNATKDWRDGYKDYQMIAETEDKRPFSENLKED